MTRHMSEDTVLKVALEMLGPRAERRVRLHLQECAKCRGLLEDVDLTMRAIKDVKPKVTEGIPILPSQKEYGYNWVRVAAMLAVGFGLGFLASESTRPPAMTVVRQQLLPKPPAGLRGGFVACDEIDTSGNQR